MRCFVEGDFNITELESVKELEIDPVFYFRKEGQR